ncbi:unnamed protein product [Ostreobium quekettii]|uniref:Uncharacterized protein n=1 Tax=Ostreobium quekettii TaxID=121088 RepID=A0A8S1ISN3_9CHLO|nr:unnamed protein product [Ostreobium quekettii]
MRTPTPRTVDCGFAQEQGIKPPPPKYEPARLGRSIRVLVNYFLVDCRAQEALHYSTEVNQIFDDAQGGQQVIDFRLKAEETRPVIRQLADQQRWGHTWVYDGKHAIYSTEEICPREETATNVTISRGRRQRKYQVKMKLVAPVAIRSLFEFIQGRADRLPQEVLQVLDIALRHTQQMNPACTAHNANFFFQSQQRGNSLGGGAQAWMGYYQSLKPCKGGLALNVDTACTAFVDSCLISDILLDIGADEHACKKIKSKLKNVKVVSIFDEDNVHKFKCIGRDRPCESMFFHKHSNRDMSVQEYFETVKGKRLRYPDLPIVDCSTTKKPIFIPAEFTRILPGQKVKGKLNAQQTAQMIRSATQRPLERKEYIEDVLRRIQFDDDPTVGAFGMRVSSQMQEIDARILPHPHLKYKDPPCMDVGTQGVWNFTRGVSFFRRGKINSWAFVSFCDERVVNDPGETGLDVFMNALIDVLRKTGVKFQGGPVVHYAQFRLSPREEILQAIDKAKRHFEDKEPNIIICLLPNNAKEIYKSVKLTCDATRGIPSQCICAPKAGIGQLLKGRDEHARRRGRDQYCNNLAMKINTKLGGTNCAIVDVPNSGIPIIGQDKAFMLLGVDVSHPQSQEESEPSIAALVASMDPAGSHYACRVKIQQHGQELVNDFKELVKELLLEFFKHNNRMKPESIIVYRDGVSEGQFDAVLSNEYDCIRTACMEMGNGDGTYCPPITFIIVQKRHHTRLLPAGGSTDRSGNVLPGTVVDTAITSPAVFDFFLNSHAGIQGTSRPSHYHVLVDENNFGPDAVQLMTYWLCYLYCRCTRSVSVVPPAYYAHLAAMRARLLVERDTSDDASSASGFSGAPQFANFHDSLKNVMFYV